MKRHGPKTRRSRRPSEPEWEKFMSDEDRREREIAAMREESLANLGLGARTVNSLEGVGLLTIGDLADQTRDELLEIDNFGETTLAECRRLLDSLNIPHPNWKRPPRRSRRKKTN
jgi:DNA-directed RNA polymerase alpha subunit